MFKHLLSKEFAKFLVVGGISTVINYLTFYLTYQFGQLHYLLASALGYVIGLSIGYVLNHHWTFNNQSAHHTRTAELLKYGLVYGSSLLLSLICLAGLVRSGIPTVVANVLVIGLSTITNFFGLRLFVFKAIHDHTVAQ